ncbi:MAG: hypothetical protein IJH92_06925 [Mogibacterium sp.]|nr:hypothetical protein [Mogibacterium sp.]
MGKNKYRVPVAVYHQCMWLVKDMDRLRRLEAVNDHGEISKNDGYIFFVDDEEVIKNNEVIAQAKWKLECVRKAIQEVPGEYRQGTIDCIVYSLPFSDLAHENTWRKWRQVFIRELAKNLLLI